ncbi:MAG: PAS domain-containing sensor histidine kinase [Candidatus Gracilibacteria bacterium]
MEKKLNIKLNNLEIYKHIVDHMTESLWIGDKNNITIFTNNIFCEITGYALEEIMGKKYSEFWDEKSNKMIDKINSEKKIDLNFKYEATLKAKDGELIPVLCSGSSTENGGTVLMISDLRELHSLKQAEKDLIKLNNTKDEFISIVGHELRTPLTSIRGYLSMILEGDMGEINPEMKKSITHTYDSSVRLIKLVNDVLSLGKIESGKMDYYIKEYTVENIINSVYKDVHLEIKNKKIKFDIIFDEDLKETIIKTDKDKLKQIFLNLLSNALKFTKSGGTITLKISKNNDKIKFEVIDTGIGIPKDKLDILFNKFSQVESTMQRHNTSGLGLGLAISRNFIKKFGSEIHVQSIEGKGSNFYFDLEL